MTFWFSFSELCFLPYSKLVWLRHGCSYPPWGSESRLRHSIFPSPLARIISSALILRLSSGQLEFSPGTLLGVWAKWHSLHNRLVRLADHRYTIPKGKSAWVRMKKSRGKQGWSMERDRFLLTLHAHLEPTFLQVSNTLVFSATRAKASFLSLKPIWIEFSSFAIERLLKMVQKLRFKLYNENYMSQVLYIIVLCISNFKGCI